MAKRIIIDNLKDLLPINKEGIYHMWVRDYVDRFQPKGVRRIIVEFDGRPCYCNSSAPQRHLAFDDFKMMAFLIRQASLWRYIFYRGHDKHRYRL
jgi:hypothetical protein